MMPLYDSVRETKKEYKTYVKKKQKWYVKIWYFITFRKNKIAKWQELGKIKDLSINCKDYDCFNIEEEK